MKRSTRETSEFLINYLKSPDGYRLPTYLVADHIEGLANELDALSSRETHIQEMETDLSEALELTRQARVDLNRRSAQGSTQWIQPDDFGVITSRAIRAIYLRRKRRLGRTQPMGAEDAAMVHVINAGRSLFYGSFDEYTPWQIKDCAYTLAKGILAKERG